MRKDLCPIDLLSYDNQMESFLAHDWPYEKARERARRQRKEWLIDLAGLVALLVIVVLVGLVIASEGGGW